MYSAAVNLHVPYPVLRRCSWTLCSSSSAGPFSQFILLLFVLAPWTVQGPNLLRPKDLPNNETSGFLRRVCHDAMRPGRRFEKTHMEHQNSHAICMMSFSFRYCYRIWKNFQYTILSMVVKTHADSEVRNGGETWGRSLFTPWRMPLHVPRWARERLKICISAL